MKCLAKPHSEIERDIEALFKPSSNDCCWEDICNGGLLGVSFSLSSSFPINSNSAIEDAIDKNNTVNDTTNNVAATATFRGRIAESGDEQQSIPEPKLSWEIRRCMHMQNTLRNAMEDGLRNNHADMLRRQSLSLLPKWTDALHSVATTVIRLLDIPTQVVLQEKQCRCCLDKRMKTSTDRRCNSCCNIDLLRVFRYDAVPQSHNNGHLNEVLGSSAHSDWGTLTIVWQDDKGGLQTYCNACKKWSNVVASTAVTTSSSSTPTTNERGKVNIELFVHVGDFLSLATIAEGTGSNHPKWPSPRHRVVCPSLRQNSREGNADTINSCRRSLVYFAYPPPGISLEAARTVVAPLSSSSSSPDMPLPENDDNRPESAEGYIHYSLLHNQSHQPQEVGSSECDNNAISSAEQTYHRIKGQPFDEVIFDKWNQVQRNGI